MDELVIRKKHRKVSEPQLAAMVDVFSLLIVFLVLGTVFNSASIALPEFMKLPKSISKNALEITNQVVITDNEVNFDFLKLKVNLKTIEEESQMKNEIIQKIKKFVGTQPSGKELVLTVLADQEVSYKNIYDIISFCRSLGFQTVSFVTTGK